MAKASKRKMGPKQADLRRRQQVRRTIMVVILLASLGTVIFSIISIWAEARPEASNVGPPIDTSKFQILHRFTTQDYHSLAFSPNRNGSILFGHHGGVQVSRDNGQSWQGLVSQSGWDAMNLVFDPFAPNTIYAAGHEIFFAATMVALLGGGYQRIYQD